MDIALIVGLVLFLIQMVAWVILPSSKSIPETAPEFSSLGDEKLTKSVA